MSGGAVGVGGSLAFLSGRRGWVGSLGGCGWGGLSLVRGGRQRSEGFGVCGGLSGRSGRCLGGVGGRCGARQPVALGAGSHSRGAPAVGRWCGRASLCQGCWGGGTLVGRDGAGVAVWATWWVVVRGGWSAGVVRFVILGGFMGAWGRGGAWPCGRGAVARAAHRVSCGGGALGVGSHSRGGAPDPGGGWGRPLAVPSGMLGVFAGSGGSRGFGAASGVQGLASRSTVISGAVRPRACGAGALSAGRGVGVGAVSRLSRGVTRGLARGYGRPAMGVCRGGRLLAGCPRG